MPKKMTQEEYFKRVNEIHNGKYNYKSEYMGMDKNILVVCPIHGEFSINASRHLHLKQGCKYCSHQSYPSTIESFSEKANLKHNFKYDYRKSIYVNNKTKLEIICPIHGSFWMRPDDHLHGHGCKKCAKIINANKQRFTKEKFETLSRTVHGNKYAYNDVEYIDYNTKIKIICPIHGEFWQTPDNHLHGHGCPHCNSSKLEGTISNALKENKISFIRQQTYDWLKYKGNLFLDFYLPEYNVAVECQGIQHYQPIEWFGGDEEFKTIIARDAVKKELCQKYGIKILYYTKNKVKNNESIFKIEDLINEIKSNGKQTTANI